MRATVARGTLRLRLTLLTSAVFLVVGAILMVVTYLLVAATLPHETRAQSLQHQEVRVCEAQAAARAVAPANN